MAEERFRGGQIVGVLKERWELYVHCIGIYEKGEMEKNDQVVRLNEVRMMYGWKGENSVFVGVE